VVDAGTLERQLRTIAVVLFLAGLLLAVRVMFFGVERRLDDEHRAHRAWPLALAAFLATAGALLYVRATRADGVTGAWLAVVVLIGLGAGAGAWWLVRSSAAVPSTDPDDDPRYRFQGHVAHVIEAIQTRSDGAAAGRIAFSFDGKRHELRARWTPGDWGSEGQVFGRLESEVVIERVEDDVAYVEPWQVVEERL
jgi:hypothetical protein